MWELERKGIATVTLCTTGFRNAGMKQASMLGIPDLPIVDIPFPFASLPLDVAKVRGTEAFAAIVAALTSGGAA
jgi:hypothetical protein